MGKFWDALAAEIRRGSKDLHNNIIPAFPAYAHGVDEPGTPLNPGATPEAEPKGAFTLAVHRQSFSAAMPANEQDKGIEL